MICNNCCKSFEGKGVICPACKPSLESGAEEGRQYNRHAFEQKLTSKKHDGVSPAGMFSRIIAFLFDGLLLGLVLGLVIAPLMSVTTIYLSRSISGFFLSSGNFLLIAASGLIIGMLTTLLVLILATPLYHAAFESSKFQGSPGKILTGLIVTDLNNQKLTIPHSLGRNLARWIGIIPYALAVLLMIIIAILKAKSFIWLSVLLLIIGSAVLTLTYPVAFFTQLNQGLHDKISGTVVQEHPDGGPANGFLFAVIGVIIFFSASIFFYDGNKPSGRFKSKKRNEPFELAALQAEFESLSKQMDLDSTVSAKPQGYTKSEGVSEPASQPATEAQTVDIPISIPTLSENNSISIDDKIIVLKKINATLGATRKNILLGFFEDETSNVPDFSMSLMFRWPLTDSCRNADLEGYSFNYATEQGKKNFSFSRKGNQHPDGDVWVSCDKAGDKLAVSFQFSGNHKRINNTIYQWKVKSDVKVDMR